MSFDVVFAAALLGFIATTVWRQVRNAQQLQFKQQQAQFWTKVLSDSPRGRS